MQETVDTASAVQGPAAAKAGPPRNHQTRLRRARRALAPLPWLAPALALITFVVLWPVWEMFQTSREHIDSYGFNLGDYGWRTTPPCSPTRTSAR